MLKDQSIDSQHLIVHLKCFVYSELNFHIVHFKCFVYSELNFHIVHFKCFVYSELNFHIVHFKCFVYSELNFHFQKTVIASILSGDRWKQCFLGHLFQSNVEPV